MALKYKANTIEDVGKINEGLNKHMNISKPIMTKFEFDKIIGLRTMQLASGSIPFVKVENMNIHSNMELRQVALRELREGRLPFIIERNIADHKKESIKEYIRVRDLDLVAVKDMMR